MSVLHLGVVLIRAVFVCQVNSSTKHTEKVMTTWAINTLSKVLEIERAHISRSLSLSQTNPYKEGYLVTRNRSIAAGIESASLWPNEWKYYV